MKTAEKTILVTGGAGFMGSDFVRYMKAEHSGTKLIVVDNLTYAGSIKNLASIDSISFYKADICNLGDMKEIFKNHDISCIVNFAAETHVDRSIADPSCFIKSNIEGTGVLLDVARTMWKDYSDKRFLQISTDEVYGALNERNPMTEDELLSPGNPYAASKASADLLALSYGNTYGIPVVITRSCNNYGPCQYPEKLIPLIIKKALNHEKLPIYGDGLQTREWMYVRDHSLAVKCAIDRGRCGNIYNITSSIRTYNIDLVKMVLQIMRELNNDNLISEELIDFVSDRPGHDKDYSMNSEKAANELKWEAKTQLHYGLLETIKWYIKLFENIR